MRLWTIFPMEHAHLQVDGVFDSEKDEGPLMLENSPASPMYTAMTPASTTFSPSSYGRPTPSYSEDAVHTVS